MTVFFLEEPFEEDEEAEEDEEPFEEEEEGGGGDEEGEGVEEGEISLSECDVEAMLVEEGTLRKREEEEVGLRKRGANQSCSRASVMVRR